MPLRVILSYLLQQAGYFEQTIIIPRQDIFRAVRLPPNKVADQIDDISYGTFCLAFMDNILRGLLIRGRITQDLLNKLKGNYAFEIFLNSTDPTVAQFYFGIGSNMKNC